MQNNGAYFFLFEGRINLLDKSVSLLLPPGFVGVFPPSPESLGFQSLLSTCLQEIKKEPSSVVHVLIHEPHSRRRLLPGLACVGGGLWGWSHEWDWSPCDAMSVQGSCHGGPVSAGPLWT